MEKPILHRHWHIHMHEGYSIYNKSGRYTVAAQQQDIPYTSGRVPAVLYILIVYVAKLYRMDPRK